MNKQATEAWVTENCRFAKMDKEAILGLVGKGLGRLAWWVVKGTAKGIWDVGSGIYDEGMGRLQKAIGKALLNAANDKLDDKTLMATCRELTPEQCERLESVINNPKKLDAALSRA